MITYAEIHYRPKLLPVPGLLFRNAPEILFDAPYRVEGGRPIPVFLIIKDADRFPVQLEGISIQVTYRDGKQRTAAFPYSGLTIDDPIWWDSVNIVPENEGVLEINPSLIYRRGNKVFKCKADNYTGLSEKPFIVNVAASPFPGKSGWFHGDIHCHSSFTSDQVEFGAPIEAMVLSGYCMGLDWIAITDHSYDLDQYGDSEQKKENGFTVSKWDMVKNISKLMESTFTVIPGEEISCSNIDGKNCHLLALNSERFIKGSGDNGKNIFNRKSEFSVREAVVRCSEWGGIAFASHPFEKVPFMEKIVLKRGCWTLEDAQSAGLIGLQIYNGVRDEGFYRGIEVWKKLLLEGNRIFIFGGNDSHGDMNRKRAVNIPLISLGEKRDHIFGNVRTIVRAVSGDRKSISGALSEGCAVITDGPFIELAVYSDGKEYFPGEQVPAGDTKIKCEVFSSSEFGELTEAKVFVGNTTEKREKVVLDYRESLKKYELSLEYSIESAGISYIRAECKTSTGRLCMTNPIWFV